MVIQELTINKVCPKSGWLTNKIVIKKRIKKEDAYLIYIFLLLLVTIIFAANIINKGFTNSIGWNLGSKKRSNQRFDPFTSTPITGTSIRRIIEITNTGVNSFIIFSLSNSEIKISKKIEMKTKTKCLVKKK